MSESVVAINNTRLWVGDSGSGRPALLIPGGPGCCDYLEPVASQIDSMSQVYRVEPRGCGRSSPDGPFDVETTLADLEALRVELGHERWIVGGHSHGAFYALVYALAFPERVDAILYLAGAGVQNDRKWSKAYHEGKDKGLEPEIAFAYPPNMEVNRVGMASARRFIKRASLWRDVANLEVPMLAVSGEFDIRPVWPVEQIVRLMPRARLEIIPGAGHDFWLTHPDELGVLLRDFVSTLAVS